jgi:N-acetyl-anhydromuramyl-L-alanine amidase AmpD
MAGGKLMIKMNNHINFIKNKFTGGFVRDDDEITTIVIHGTGGGGTLNWIKNCKISSKRGQRYKRGIALFHFLIRRKGEIDNLIDSDNWVYHSSIGNYDRHTIGIELLNPSPGNLATYTDKQYNDLCKLIKYLISKYKNIDTIISHNKMKRRYHRNGKVCPGPLFRWKKLAKTLNLKYIEKGVLKTR